MVKRTCLAAALCLLSACGGSKSDAPNVDPTPDKFAFEEVATLDLDGIVVIDQPSVQGSPNMAFTLFNPRAGKLAAAQWQYGSAFGAPQSVAPSPDGEHIAWVEGRGEAQPTVRIGRVFLHADGMPDLEIVHERQAWVGDFLFFNAQGDRLVSGHFWWDFAGDRIHECTTVDPAARTNSVIPSPDGRTYIGGCGDEDSAIWEDFKRVGRPSYAVNFTHDGEFLTHPLYEDVSHVYSRAIANLNLGRRPLGEDVKPLPDGTVGGSLYLRAGEHIIYRDVGGVSIPVIEDFGPGSDNSRQNSNTVFDIWSRGVVEGAGPRISTVASAPILSLPDGAEMRLIGLSPQMDEAIFELQVWTIEGRDNFDPTTGIFAPRTKPRYSRLIRTAVGGDTLLQNHFEPGTRFCQGSGLVTPSPLAHLLDFGRVPSGWVHLDENISVCRDEAAFGNWHGVRGDEGLEVLGNGTMASLSSEALVGQDALDDTAHRVCATPWASSKWQCVDAQTMVSRVSGIVGWAVQRNADSGPVPLLISPTAAAPGREVVLRGHGLGSSGILRIGEFEVPSQAIATWADTEIRFTMPEGAPDIGRVTVEGSSARKALWLYKTQRFDHRLARLDELDLTMRPGVSVFDVPADSGLDEMVFNVGTDHFFNNGKLVIVGQGNPRFEVTDGNLRRWICAEVGDARLDPAVPWQIIPTSLAYASDADHYPNAENVLGRLVLTSGDTWQALVEYKDGLPVDRLGFGLDPNYDTVQKGLLSRGTAAYRADGAWMGWVRSLRAGYVLIAQTGWNSVLRMFTPLLDYAQGNILVAFGDTLVRMGRFPTNNVGHYWRSDDGGNTWPVEGDIDVGFAEATTGIGVDTGGQRFVIGVRGGAQTTPSFFRFDIDTATLETHWATLPVGITQPDAMRFYRFGTTVVAWSPMDEAAWSLDATSETPSPVRLRIAGSERITAWYDDAKADRYLVATGDQIHTSSRSNPDTWSPFGTPIALPIDMPTTIRALGLDANGYLYVFIDELAANRPSGLGYPGGDNLTGALLLQP